MEAVRDLEEIICKNIRTEIVQDLRDNFRKLTQLFGKVDFDATAENQLVDLRFGYAGFPENLANSHICILQIRRRISLERQHFVP